MNREAGSTSRSSRWNVAPEDAIHVDISDMQNQLRIDGSTLETLVREVLLGEGVRQASISIALVDDATIRELNRQHLDHDWPTDVISFRLSDSEESTLSADLVLSAEMAMSTALAAGTEPRDELALYLVHGLLHLCGYDDRSTSEIALMRRREAEVLAKAGFPNTYSATRRTTIADPGETSW